MDKKYTSLIEGVEDLDGVNDYMIGSDEPIPQEIINDLARGYVGISEFELVCKLHGLLYEPVDDDQQQLQEYNKEW